MFNTLIGKYGGVAGHSVNDVQYYSFNSPGSVDLTIFPSISRIDIFGISAGGTGSYGSPGTYIDGTGRGGPGGAGGLSGLISVHLNAPISGSSIPITIGQTYPQTVDGPQPAPSSPLSIPSNIKDVFTGYNIIEYAKGVDGVNQPGDGYSGRGGFGGAGGVYFSPTGLSTSTHPVLPSPISGTTGSTGGTAGPRLGGTGGEGGEGYGAGGGGGGGGSEYLGSTGGGGQGSPGSGGMTVVRIEL